MVKDKWLCLVNDREAWHFSIGSMDWSLNVLHGLEQCHFTFSYISGDTMLILRTRSFHRTWVQMKTEVSWQRTPSVLWLLVPKWFLRFSRLMIPHLTAIKCQLSEVGGGWQRWRSLTNRKHCLRHCQLYR